MNYTILNKICGLAIIMMISFAGLQARARTMDVPSVMVLDTTPPVVHDTMVVKTYTAPVAHDTLVVKNAPAPAHKDSTNSVTRFGIRVGGLISRQEYESTSLDQNPESKIGLDLAILVSAPIGDGTFMLQPELHWMQKGYKIKDVSNQDLTTTLNYVEIPLLARINFGEEAKVFIFAGPAIGWLISGSIDPDNDQDPTDFLNNTEVSGYVGLGIGVGPVEVDLRYIAGLNDISSSEDFTNARNSSFGLGITLKF